MTTAPKAAPRAGRVYGLWAALIGLVLFGSALRIVAACDNLWFDEVWSLLTFAARCESPLDVFNQAHDNNHHLITWWMYVCGPQQQHGIVYRLPALVAGIATIVLASLAARPYGPWAAFTAILFTALSFELVTYSSEARGYALAGCFALGAWLALVRYDATRGIPANVAFCACVLLGLLSHVTFVFFLAGALVWWLAESLRAGRSSGRMAIDFARCFAVPLAGLAALYFVHIRNMIIGGGPVADVVAVVVQSFALIFGRFGHAWYDRAAALVAAACLLAALAVLARCDWPLALFFVVTIFAAPAGAMLLRRPEQLYARYFFLPLLFSLLLLAIVLGRLARRGLAGYSALAALLLLYVAGNAESLRGFLRDGRGQYLAALQYIVEQSPSEPIVVESDHDYESARMIAFYYPSLPEGTKLSYEKETSRSFTTPQWAIIWSQEQPYAAPQTIRDLRNRPYVLKRVFPYSGLSGYHWAVYRSAYWEQ